MPKAKQLIERASLTPEQDNAWVKYFTYYVDNGEDDASADEKAWQDLVKTFPELRKYSGATQEAVELRAAVRPLDEDSSQSFSTGERVTLTKPIWGHKAGSVGVVKKAISGDKINKYTAQIKLKGSPKMYVRSKDVQKVKEDLTGKAEKALIKIKDWIAKGSHPQAALEKAATDFALDEEEFKAIEKRIFMKTTEAQKLVDNLLEDCGECDPDEEGYVECPQCGGDGKTLGTMGEVIHYRCRNCGWVFSKKNVVPTRGGAAIEESKVKEDGNTIGTPSHKEMVRSAIEIMVDNGKTEKEAEDTVNSMSTKDIIDYLESVREGTKPPGRSYPTRSPSGWHGASP